MREAKALEIAARLRLAYRDGAWHVPSQNGGGTYKVTLRPPSCTCEDFALRQQPCKHVIAARLVQERDHSGQAPAIDTDVLPKKPTCKRDWPLYDAAQRTEKHRFHDLLFDLCLGVDEPPAQKKPGRKPHTVRDCVYAMALKTYSTLSSRRFSCDLGEAHGRGHVSRLMPGIKVCAFFESPELTPVLHRLIMLSSLPLRAVETTFAPDSTGFSVSRFVRWYDEKYGQSRSGKDWVKAHAICGVTTNVVTAVEIAGRDANDSPMFRPLVQATARNFAVKEVVADKAYLSHENLELVDGLGGTAFVPFKSNSGPGEAGSVWERMFHYYNFRREEFLRHYHQRSNSESTFSMLKAKFRDHVRSKTDTAMKNEVLCKFLCHNIVVVHQSHVELGIEPVFWPEGGADDDGPNVLPLVRPV
jgi:transposase